MKRFAKAAMAAAAVLLAGTAGSPPTLTGIEVKLSPPKDVTVRGTGEAGTGYLLQWSKWLGEGELWEDAGEATAGADGAFAVSSIAECCSPGFYRVVEGASAGGYLVVDMGGGTNVSAWPVTELDSVPEGGWTDEYKTTKLVLRRIPAGTFAMGSPAGERGRATNELQHAVTFSQGFYAGVFEVTQKQWELAMGQNPAQHKGDTRPVENVTWDMIRGNGTGAVWPQWQQDSVDEGTFLDVLRMKTRIAFNLPTEAQWEYACRAGTTNALNSGKDLTAADECPEMDEVGRYAANQDDGKGGCSEAHTAVGSYRPNVWGLYDMHGNVFEWCLDWYAASWTEEQTDPVGPSTGDFRVVRGGGWEVPALSCRSACRGGIDPLDASIPLHAIGFRLVAP
jgi:formylglycine-generating enzyme required for sulfatase activity